MERTALIVCNGAPPSLQLMRQLWSEVDLTLCADGGANFAVSQGFIPDFIVGDMDSILPEIQQQLEAKRFVEMIEQDTNDGDKALRYCLKQRIDRVHLLGASGGRSDQFLANIELLYKYTPKLKILLWTAMERMEVIEEEWKEKVAVGTTLSLLPLFGAVHGITTSGLAYPLDNATLELGKEPCGVSNETVEASVRISMKTGKLLLILQISN